MALIVLVDMIEELRESRIGIAMCVTMRTSNVNTTISQPTTRVQLEEMDSVVVEILLEEILLEDTILVK